MTTLPHIPWVTRGLVAGTLCLSLVVLISQWFQQAIPVGVSPPAPLLHPLDGPTSSPPPPEQPIPTGIPSTQTAESYLVLYPGLILTRPWTLVLTGWIETDWLVLLIHLGCLTLMGSSVERWFQWFEYLKFVWVVNIVAPVAVFFIYVCTFAASRNIGYLYNVSIHGLPALISGLTVALKQTIPEHKVVLYHRLGSFRIKYLPLLYILGMGTVALVLKAYASCWLLITGVVSAWFYLRFFKYYNGIRGDLSEAFSFATFFPDTVQPPVAFVCNRIFNVFVWLRVLKPLSEYTAVNLEQGNPTPRPPTALFGSEETDAERRRALATKAVELRLLAAGTSSSAS
ncbi:hypothetical protein IWQ61_000002 [Dispira simplex]|nr:hypothetical protein IWQ61_000002 [Dispira simplex]